MGGEYPSWHPLSTVSRHAEPCSCDGKPNVILGQAGGAVACFCDRCDGYVP